MLSHQSQVTRLRTDAPVGIVRRSLHLSHKTSSLAHAVESAHVLNLLSIFLHITLKTEKQTERSRMAGVLFSFWIILLQ